MMMESIGYAETVYEGQPAIISTVRLPDGMYETMVMRRDGEEIECVRSFGYHDAVRAHDTMLMRYMESV